MEQRSITITDSAMYTLTYDGHAIRVNGRKIHHVEAGYESAHVYTHRFAEPVVVDSIAFERLTGMSPAAFAHLR